MSRLCREDLEKKVRARVERRMSKLWGNRPPSHGLFGHKPGTQEEHLIWTVSRHKTIQLAGIRALVLQLSDPVIAQGVNDYSRFRTEPQDRVKKTFGAIAAVLYGNRAQVVDALVGIYMAHTTIKGVLSVASGGKARVGESYKATSRVSSGYWVFATVVEAIIHGFQATVRELDKTELDELWGDCMRLGRALYVRESHLPKTWADFRKDFDQRIEASAVHRTQEDLVEHLFNGKLTRYWFDESAAVFTLPPKFLGLVPHQDNALVMGAYWLTWRGMVAASLLTNRIAPERLRLSRTYLAARDRIAL